MSIKYVGNFTNAMKAYSEEKIERIKKHFEYSDVTVKVNVLGENVSVEISIDNRVRAKQVGEDFYVIINKVVDKVISQIERYKKNSPVEVLSEDDEDGNDDDSIIAREKVIILDEMSIYEAIENMDLLGHNFFIYKDIDKKAVCTVYKRADGTYGVLIGK